LAGGDSQPKRVPTTDIAIEYGSGSSGGDANMEMTTSIEDEECRGGEGEAPAPV
jgi:hypothetical protein